LPGATAQIGEHEVEILQAETRTESALVALTPGEALHTPEGLVVKAADGGVLLRKLRLPDGRLLHGAAALGLCPKAE
jgi:methionyl-tRNA formyltransferase